MVKVKIMFSAMFLSTFLCFSSFAGEWRQDANGWKYQNDDGSYTKSSWKEINGKWYYFNEGEYMLSNTTTPDGHAVNESGEWTQPKEATKKYVFETNGKWVDSGNIPAGEYVYYPGDQRGSVMIRGSYSPQSNFNYIRLYKGDELNAGTYIPVSDVGELDISKEGVFRVGKDIKAGTYTVTRIDPKNTRATCTVFGSIPSSKDESTTQNNVIQDLFVFAVPKEVTVSDGQYIQIIGCTANFVRP